MLHLILVVLAIVFALLALFGGSRFSWGAAAGVLCLAVVHLIGSGVLR